MAEVEANATQGVHHFWAAGQINDGNTLTFTPGKHGFSGITVKRIIHSAGATIDVAIDSNDDGTYGHVIQASSVSNGGVDNLNVEMVAGDMQLRIKNTSGSDNKSYTILGKSFQP